MNQIIRLLKVRSALFSSMLIGLMFIPSVSKAHKEPVHAAIARGAYLSSDGCEHFLVDALGDANPVFSFKPFEFAEAPAPRPAIYWVTNGAYQQDYWPRWGNHFYTVKPIRTAGKAPGLSDKKEGFLGILPTPVTNSFAWATDASIETPKLFNLQIWKFDPPPPSQNEDRWGKAREYQLAALSSSLKATRDDKMARMFYSLGQIIHLNQDCSQPDHTRDDAHPWKPYIEKYGEKTYSPQPGAFAPVPRGWAYWRDQAHFKKLLDFWDRGFYTGNASALNADATGAAANKLGIAEFSNGNFLGEDSLYSDILNQTSPQYFPFPSLASTEEFDDNVTLENGKIGTRIYLAKTSDGIPVSHHSALKYLAVVNAPKVNVAPRKAFLSINDPNVLQAYHSILIPKAIEYSGGILDYFFRGKIETAVTWDSTLQKYKIQITNKSGQAFKNGTFALYGDDASGNRTPINFATYGYANTLNDNASFDATFSLPQTAPKNCVLVYKDGTIGVNGTEALDSVDKEIAIAIKKVWLITTPSPLPNGTAGSPYSTTLEQAGLTTPAWQITEGSLPPALTLEPLTGVISGTPTVSGTFNFIATAQDALGHSASKAFSLKICTPFAWNVTWGTPQIYTGDPVGASSATAHPDGLILDASQGQATPHTHALFLQGLNVHGNQTFSSICETAVNVRVEVTSATGNESSAFVSMKINDGPYTVFSPNTPLNAQVADFPLIIPAGSGTFNLFCEIVSGSTVGNAAAQMVVTLTILP